MKVHGRYRSSMLWVRFRKGSFVKKIYYLLIALSVLMAVGVAVFHVNSSPIEIEEPAVVEEVEKPAPLQTFGDDNGKAVKLTVTNKTDLPIVGFAVKDALDTSYPENIMEKSQEIAANETVQVYVELNALDKKEGDEDSDKKADKDTDKDVDRADDKKTSEPTADMMALNTRYCIEVTCDDDKDKSQTFELYDLNLEDIREFDIVRDDDLIFIEYVDPDTGEKASTEKSARAEQKAREEAAKAEKEAAKKAAKAEEEAAAAQEGTAPTSDTSSGWVDTTPAPAPAPAPAPTNQNPDNCFGDDAPILNF